MKIHEYQAKRILAKYGAAVPRGDVAETPQKAVEIAKSLGGEVCVVKAQIHAGGRGKGGGVKVSKGLNAVEENAEAILGMQLVTHQTGPEGQKVKRVLVEEGMDIKKELYCSLLIDRGSQSVVFLASTEGGMDIEEVAANTPEKICKVFVNPTIGFRSFQAAELAYHLKVGEINPKLVRPTAALMTSLYNAFVNEDCSLVEINPLVLTGDGRVIALDAKMTFDDSGLFRHKDILDLRDLDEEEASEVEASQADLSYIKLDGNIGCMVNGAGLAMGTMDIIKSFGGEPANFLDVGGTADQQRVATAFRIITADSNVKCILVNIFGGIVRCDVVAEGIVAAFKEVNLDIPVVVRLAGTNADKAEEIISQSGLGNKLQMAIGLRGAAEAAVAAAR
ncbi:MAG: ADP-forming succinate--CoA ligase subunit beta [SAR324 cluster bacterium]|nr:ADP-forming succinate--CoA ligase subunit beta [SAR324 cluster bacterium]